MEEKKVQTCDFYRTDPNLPHRFNNPDCFHGYGQKTGHPLYRTSNQTYGSKRPTVHEMQTQFRGTSRTFSEAQLRSGMYRHHGFNVSVDGSRVTVSTATHHRRANLQYLYHHGNHGSSDHGDGGVQVKE